MAKPEKSDPNEFDRTVSHFGFECGKDQGLPDHWTAEASCPGSNALASGRTTGPYRSHSTQKVRFVGGQADGLRDFVEEVSPGRLPSNLESMGSIYRLVKMLGLESEYHFLVVGECSEN